MYTAAPSAADLELERRRRAILCAYGTATGLLPPPYAPSKTVLDRTIRRPEGGGGHRLARILQSHTRSKLLQSPTAHSPCVKAALKSLSRLGPCQVQAGQSSALPSVSRPKAIGDQASSQEGHESQTCPHDCTSDPLPLRPATSASAAQAHSCQDPTAKIGTDRTQNTCETAERSSDVPVTQVTVAPIGDPCLSDPMECDAAPFLDGSLAKGR